MAEAITTTLAHTEIAIIAPKYSLAHLPDRQKVHSNSCYSDVNLVPTKESFIKKCKIINSQISENFYF